MKTFKVTYTFEEEIPYESEDVAKAESDDLASNVADSEGLMIVSVKVEEVKESAGNG
jgi:hypothetical protein